MCETKKCIKCNEEKTATSEFFKKQKECKDGLSGICKTCSNASARKYRLANLEKARKSGRESKNKHKDATNARLRERYRNDPEYRANEIIKSRRYEESGKRAKNNAKPETKERTRIRVMNRRNNPITNDADRKWRKEYHDKLKNEISDSYIASCVRLRKCELTPELIEIKRKEICLIRKIRELQES